ncbi:MAG: hypothetical protein GY906_23415 [bacterium]|nr:hypothetical protein [bacterium]
MTKTKSWTDDTPMPWGEHRGTLLKDIPASYLLWLFEQTWIRDWPPLHAYLKKHEDQLMQERAQRDEQRMDNDEDGFTSFKDYEDYRGP